MNFCWFTGIAPVITHHNIAPSAHLRRLESEAIAILREVVAVEGRPAVKLSDNPAKIAGPEAEVARYKRVFDYRMSEARPA